MRERGATRSPPAGLWSGSSTGMPRRRYIVEHTREHTRDKRVSNALGDATVASYPSEIANMANVEARPEPCVEAISMATASAARWKSEEEEII